MYCHSNAFPGSSSASTQGPWSYPGQWPLPMKALAVVAGFALFKPLGLVALGYFWFDARRRRRGAGFGPGGFSGNSAFDERRRETLQALAEDERAFAEFRRKEREARDRELFDRFRNAPRPRTDDTTQL